MPKGHLLVYALYQSPSLDIFAEDYKPLFKSKLPLIAAGDFNAKHLAWNSHRNDSRGINLLKIIDKYKMKILAPNTYTHFPANRNRLPNVLDFSVHNLASKMKIEVVEELDSDHLPIIISLDESYTPPPEDRLNYKKADWDGYRILIDGTLNREIELSQPINIDIAVTHITETIHKAAIESIPTTNKSNYSNLLPPEIRKLIEERNKLLKNFRRSLNPHIKTVANSLRKIIRDKISKFRNENWTNTLTNLNVSDQSLWTMAKRLTRKKFQIPPIKIQDGYAISPEQKITAIAKSICTTFKPHDFQEDPEQLKTVEKTITELQETPTNWTVTDPIRVSPTEITMNIKHLKNRKAPGQDKINNLLIKKLPASAIEYLAELFTACLKIGHFPSEWKIAKILVFPKPGKNLTLPNSYRPISLLNSISKLLEKSILHRLNSHLVTNNILRQEQFGFRKAHSTQQQIIRITEYISHNFNFNRNTGAVLLDVEKASDSVWHTGLIYKIHQIKTPPLINKLGTYDYIVRRKYNMPKDFMNHVTNNILVTVSDRQRSSNPRVQM